MTNGTSEHERKRDFWGPGPSSAKTGVEARCLLCAQPLSCVQICVTSWAVAHQAPQSMEFSRQEYWSGLSFPTPREMKDSPELKGLAGLLISLQMFIFLKILSDYSLYVHNL